MPKGPRGEKRPGDVIGAAIKVAKIATGEIEGYGMDRRAGRSRCADARAARTIQEAESKLR
jgi:hypothetical protein